MADSTEGQDPTGGKSAVQPGGSPSRGPNPDPGGKEEAGGLVPPYEGRTSGGEEETEPRADSVKRQLADTKTGPPGATASPADEQPASAERISDAEPDTPKGVGKSTTRSGEDVGGGAGKEAGRHDTEAKGDTDRPAGKSDPRDKTGVDP